MRTQAEANRGARATDSRCAVWRRWALALSATLLACAWWSARGGGSLRPDAARLPARESERGNRRGDVRAVAVASVRAPRSAGISAASDPCRRDACATPEQLAAWRATFAQLLAENPAHALQWLSAVPVPLHDAMAAEPAVVFQRLMRHDPREAGNAIAEFPSGTLGTSLAAHYALDLSQRDPIAAVRWAESLPYHASREAALREALASWAQRDAEAAARYLREEIPVGELRRSLAADIAWFRR